jgi:hypothetical protein
MPGEIHYGVTQDVSEKQVFEVHPSLRDPLLLDIEIITKSNISRYSFNNW